MHTTKLVNDGKKKWKVKDWKTKLLDSLSIKLVTAQFIYKSNKPNCFQLIIRYYGDTF